MGKFENQIVFITGGASGIGKATAIAFAKEGAQIALADRSEQVVELADELDSQGYQVKSFLIDVTDRSSVASGFEQVTAEFGHVDVAFNNAGVGGVEAKTVEYPDDDWDKVIAANLTGVFTCMKAELQHMIPRRKGVIVNTASVAGVLGFPWHAAYAASKHGVIGLTKSAATEVARYGVRVNAMCPGFTHTPMLEEMLAIKPDREQKMKRAIPLHRLAQPEEIAAGVLFLASEENQFMVGHALVLDGGASVI